MLKIICWLEKRASKLQEPWKFATGGPKSASTGVTNLLVIEGGILPRSKVHICIP